jgi:hypothetical protein
MRIEILKRRGQNFAAALNAQISPINSRTQDGDRAQTVHL